ncbi:MAG: hypothetical protein AB8G15_19890 [Saprospiraceae bacterium]
MKIISPRCNNCGANVKIKPNVRFFSCDHCGSSLTISQSKNKPSISMVEKAKNKAGQRNEKHQHLLNRQAKKKSSDNKRTYNYTNDEEQSPYWVILFIFIIYVLLAVFVLPSNKSFFKRNSRPNQFHEYNSLNSSKIKNSRYPYQIRQSMADYKSDAFKFDQPN